MATSRSVTGWNVRRILADRGRSQTELAAALGVTTSAIWQKLSGIRSITDSDVVKIAAFLEVDPGELFRSVTAQPTTKAGV